MLVCMLKKKQTKLWFISSKFICWELLSISWKWFYLTRKQSDSNQISDKFVF